MRLLILLLFIPVLVLSQSLPKSLKTTLSEASSKYQIIFTFDDGLMSTYLELEEEIPEKLETFLSVLSKEYLLESSKSDESIILSPISGYENNTICGYIKSDLFNGVLENTLIILGHQFTQSDNSGLFSFRNVDLSVNKIHFKNFKFGTVDLPIDDYNNCSSYFIDFSEINLGEVIVNYIAPPIKKSSNGVIDINLNDFITSPGSINPDVFELIQLLPGINTPNEDNDVFIRGGTPDQNNILWNTIRVYQNNHANGGLSSLNPYGIDKIKLLLKGVPSTYGEHTSGLIILDNYKKPSSSLFKGSLGLGILDTDLVTNINLKEKFQVNLSLRTSFKNVLSNTFKSNTFNKIIGNTNNQDSFTNQNIYYNDFTFSSRFKLNNNEFLDVHSFYLEDKIGYKLIGNDLEYKDKLNAINLGVGIRFNQVKDFWRHLYSLSYTDFEMLYDRQLYTFEFDEQEKEYDSDYEDLTFRRNHIKEFFFKTKHSRIVREKYNILLGSDLVYRDVALSNQTKINNQTRNISENLSGYNFALYGSMKSKLSHKNQIELGLRYNYYHSISASRVEPRINFTHFLNQNWLINTTFEKKSQSISRTNETTNNTTNQTNNLWTLVGNELYPLLKSTQISLGSTRKVEGFIFEFDFYKKFMSGITTFNFGYLDPNDKDFHLGNSEILGFDLFFQKSWKPMNIWLSYSYQDNQNRFEGLKSGIRFNSNFMIKHRLTLGVNYKYKNWSINTNFNVRSGVPYSKPSGYLASEGSYQLMYDTLNKEFLPRFERLDASVSKRFLIRNQFRFDVKLALKNITNRRNVLDRIHLLDKNSLTIRKFDRYSMVPLLNFAVRFHF